MSKDDSQVIAGPDTGASLGKFECHHHHDGSMVYTSCVPGKFMAMKPDEEPVRGHKGNILQFHSVQDAWHGLAHHDCGMLHPDPGMVRLLDWLASDDEFDESPDDDEPDAPEEPAQRDNPARKEAAP